MNMDNIGVFSLDTYAGKHLLTDLPYFYVAVADHNNSLRMDFRQFKLFLTSVFHGPHQAWVILEICKTLCSFSFESVGLMPSQV